MVQNAIRKKVIIVLISVVILFSLVDVVNANGPNEKIADYKLTYYADGMAFTGSTTVSEQNISNSVSTYYGNYNNVAKMSFSDFSASANYNGKTINLVISNWYSYFDYNTGYTLSTQSTTSVSSPSTSTKVSHTIIVEESVPTITKDNGTTIKQYNERHQEDNTVVFYNISEKTTPESNVNLTLDSGTFQTTKYVEMDYSNNVFSGSVTQWVENDGTLIKMQQYDQSGVLLLTMSLTHLYNGSGAKASPAMTIEPFLLSAVVLVGLRKLKTKL